MRSKRRWREKSAKRRVRCGRVESREGEKNKQECKVVV